MRFRTRLGFFLIGITYVTTITAILAGCGAPFSKNWQIYPNPGSKSCYADLGALEYNILIRADHCQPAISKMDLFFTVVLNVLTDAYLLSIPLPVSMV